MACFCFLITRAQGSASTSTLTDPAEVQCHGESVIVAVGSSHIRSEAVKFMGSVQGSMFADDMFIGAAELTLAVYARCT